jgi:hypothetical protein
MRLSYYLWRNESYLSIIIYLDQTITHFQGISMLTILYIWIIYISCSLLLRLQNIIFFSGHSSSTTSVSSSSSTIRTRIAITTTTTSYPTSMYEFSISALIIRCQNDDCSNIILYVRFQTT